MNRTRWRELETTGAALTADEMRAGWHFCPEWDFMLTNYNDKEGETCGCQPWRESTIAMIEREQK